MFLWKFANMIQLNIRFLFYLRFLEGDISLLRHLMAVFLIKRLWPQLYWNRSLYSVVFNNSIYKKLKQNKIQNIVMHRLHFNASNTSKSFIHISNKSVTLAKSKYMIKLSMISFLTNRLIIIFYRFNQNKPSGA